MASTLGKILDEVVTALASATPAVTAVKVYDPTVELKDLAAGRVAVCPKSFGLNRLTRATFQKESQVDVAVQKKLAEFVDQATDDAAIEAVMESAETIALFLAATVLSSGGQPSSVSVPAIYSPKDIRELRVVTSVLTVTYLQ